MFKDEAVKARRARTAALADTHGRERLAARLKRSFDQERDELEDALTTLTDRGLHGLPKPREASLLLLTLLFMPTFMDVHPRLKRPAAQAMAQRYRRGLHHVILGKAPPKKSLPLPGSLGMDDVEAPELPSLTPFGEEVVEAAIALLDEEGQPTIKIGPLTEKVGAIVSRVYREVGDVATIDRHAQARRLIGAAIADIDTLHAAPSPASPDAL